MLWFWYSSWMRLGIIRSVCYDGTTGCKAHGRLLSDTGIVMDQGRRSYTGFLSTLCLSASSGRSCTIWQYQPQNQHLHFLQHLSIHTIATSPVVSLGLRGKEKKDASEHLQKRAQTRASEHLSATSATTPLVGVPHTTSQARQGCIEDDDSGSASTSLFQPPTSVVAQHHARISLVGDFIFGWEITGRWGMPLIYFSR